MPANGKIAPVGTVGTFLKKVLFVLFLRFPLLLTIISSVPNESSSSVLLVINVLAIIPVKTTLPEVVDPLKFIPVLTTSLD